MKKVLAGVLAVIMAGAISGCMPRNSKKPAGSLTQSQKAQVSQSEPQISEAESSESSSTSKTDMSGNEVSNIQSVPETGDKYNVAVHIDFEHNAIFSTYDVDVSVDGTKQQTLKHGTDSDFTLSLTEGEHSIVFANSEDASVDGSVLLNVTEDMKVSYKISCHRNEVKIEDKNSSTVNESSVVSSADHEASVTSVPEENSSGSILGDVIRPEIKEAVDSYEAFVDEYCDFLKKMSKTSDTITMLEEYNKYIEKLSDMSEKFDKIENEDLTTAESAYYTEVMLRCNKKMLEASNDM